MALGYQSIGTWDFKDSKYKEKEDKFVDIEEMKKIMLEDPAAALRDEVKNSIATKVKSTFTFSDMLKELRDEESEKANEIVSTKEEIVIEVADLVEEARAIEPVDKIKEALLKNTNDHIENVNRGNPTNSAWATDTMVRNMVSRMIDMQAAKHFVGIQPMTAPVGLIYLLEYEIDETPTSEEMVSALGTPNANAIESTSKRMCLNVNSHTVEAGTRKLATNFTLELMQDMNAGLNVEDADPASDIAQEIYEEIRHDIIAAAAKESFDMEGIITDIAEVDQNKINALAICINKCANEIARKTRRGAGNFLIASETIAEILKNSDNFVKTPSDEYDYGYVKYIGTLHGCIKVYCDFNLKHNKAIVGYKGGRGETDTGYFYCPYVPLMSSVVVNPTTFQPVVSLMTRYGKYVNQKSEDSTTKDGLSTTITREPCNYYVDITFDNLPHIDNITFKKEEKKETDVMEVVSDTVDSLSDAFESAMELLD